MSTTPNMNLTLPTVSQTPGPSWASQINTAFSTIDSHSHTIGNGVAITTAALDIDDDLSFGQNAALNLSSIGLVNQASTPSSLRLYVTGNDLWYSYDGITPVQITTGGSIVGATGNISGMSPPAAVIFDSGTGTFTFWSNQSLNQQATLVSAQLRLRASIVAAPVTVAASVSGTTYTLTLPASPPGSQGLVGFSSGGTLSPVSAGDSSISITSSTISVATSGISSTQLASSAVLTSKISDNAVTQAKLETKSTSGTAASGVNIGPSNTVVFASFTCNLVAGRPALITLDAIQNTGTAPASVPPAASFSCNGAPSVYIAVTHPNGTTQTQMCHFVLPSGYSAPSSIHGLFNVISTGTHTIQLASYCGTVFDAVTLANGFIKAFQL